MTIVSSVVAVSPSDSSVSSGSSVSSDSGVCSDSSVSLVVINLLTRALFDGSQPE